jgi:hypothetical protein
LQGTYVGKTTLIKALAFGGTEKTYQSWNGLEDLDLLKMIELSILRECTQMHLEIIVL